MKDRAKTEDAILAELKARGPLTAAVLAERIGITAVGLRQHLKRMEEEAVVRPCAEPEEQAAGAGRPAARWELSEKGHEQFGDSHALLTRDLIDGTRAVFGEEGLEKLIAHREAQSLAAYRKALAGARDLRERVERLAALREAEGYMAVAAPDEEGGFLLVENHCPICTAALSCQGFCRSELAIFKEVLGPEAEVERLGYLPGGARRCSYAIRPVARE